MAWLLYEGQVVASVESYRSVKPKLLRSCHKKLRDVKGVLLIKDSFFVHNFMASDAVDVVLLDKDFLVLKNVMLGKNRILFIPKNTKYILLASTKTLANYRIDRGDLLKIAGD
ncbi:MAG: hypothetical protein M1374_07080 [Firmicutes bacterium]|nr:hypothetical protein [Bacillota bacterium]